MNQVGVDMDTDKIMEQIQSYAGAEDVEWGRGPNLFHLGIANNAGCVEMEMGKILYDIVLNCKPLVAVEVGTHIGYSSTWIALALAKLQKGHLITFDIAEVPNKFWSKFKLDFYVTFRQDGCLKYLPTSIDFAFIDSSHTIKDTHRELDSVMPFISVGGVVAFHDTQLCECGNVIRNYLRENPKKWSWKEMKVGRGIIIATRL